MVRMSTEAAHVRPCRRRRRRRRCCLRCTVKSRAQCYPPGMQERTLVQRLGQSFNSAGIALFARIVLVGDAPLAALLHAWRVLVRCLNAGSPAPALTRLLISPPHRATGRWRCRTWLCPTYGGWTGARWQLRASRASCLTRTTR